MATTKKKPAKAPKEPFEPPVLVGTAATIKKQLGSLEAVQVTPVARIAVTEVHMENIIKAFQDTLRRYRKQKDAK